MEIQLDEDLWRPNPGGQADFMEDYRHRYLALAGGWFAGKTWAGARKLLNLHLYNAVDDAGRLTGVDSCVIAQTYNLAQTINIPELRKALGECGLRYQFVSDTKKYWFELPDLGTPDDPSLIYVRTADAPDKITGFTVGSIWGDEVARWKSNPIDPLGDPILQADGRLRDFRARALQFLMTFTHEGDATKVYQDFEQDPKPGHKLYRSGSFDNPFAKDFVAAQLAVLTPELASQYISGNAANLRGNAVYSSYEDARNRDDTLVLDPRLPLHLSVDFNINPGMHAIVGQHFPADDLVTAVHEIHRPRMDVRQMVADLFELVKRLGGWQWPELHLFGDPSGDSKWSASGSQSAWDVLIEAVRQNSPAGKPVLWKKKVPAGHFAVGDRVNATNCALRSVDGRVRYRIHGAQTPERHTSLLPGCPRLIQDFKRLKWDAGEIDKDDRKLSHASEADSNRVAYLMPIRKPTKATGSVGFGGGAG
jgi:hypothetical protein